MSEQTPIAANRVNASTGSKPDTHLGAKPKMELEAHHTIPANLKRNMHSAKTGSPGTTDAERTSMFDKDATNRFKKFIGPAKDIGKKAIDSTVGLTKDTATLATGTVKKVLTDPSRPMARLRTWLFGAGGIVSGYFSLKSVIKAFTQFYGKRKSDFSPWIHLFDGLLTGGLALGLTSPFTGWSNPFAKVIDGKLDVAPTRVVGALAASIILKTVMAISEGRSIFNKIFRVFGLDLQEITDPVIQGVNWLTSDENPEGGPGGGAGNNAGAGGGGLAQALGGANR